MATIYREFFVGAPAEEVWSAVRDFGAVHTRLAVGFVTNTQLEGNWRTVTFANGFVVREQLVALDEQNKRISYAASGGLATHHNASFQVIAGNNGLTRVLWITDLLPDDIAAPV